MCAVRKRYATHTDNFCVTLTPLGLLIFVDNNRKTLFAEIDFRFWINYLAAIITPAFQTLDFQLSQVTLPAETSFGFLIDNVAALLI
jgi:hypothetical protein